MQGQSLGRLAPDMDVCDSHGDKIGTVARVYRYDLAAVGGGPGAGRLPHEEVLEVKTGFLGLVHHLYVPLSAIQDLTQGCVFLSRSREEFDEVGWPEKPSYLDELH